MADEPFVESESLDHAALNSLTAGIAVLNRSGKLVLINEAWRRLVGKHHLPGRINDCIGRDYLELIATGAGTSAEHAEFCLKGLRAMLDGELLEFEGELVWRSSLDETHLRLHAVPLASPAGGLVVCHVDMAQRWPVLSTLEDNHAQLRLMLDSTAEGIYRLDLEGRCTFCNRTALRLLGYDDLAAVLGRNMHELMHHTRDDGTPYPQHECRIFQAFQQGRGVHVDDELIWRSDGTSFPAEYWSYPIHREGMVIGAVVTFLDISEQRAAEERLRQAQKMEAIGHLTGGVAHDFNNLLAIVLGNLELLQERLDARAEVQELVQSAMTAAERGTTLVQRLLAFSRRQPLRVRPTDLNALVKGLIELLRQPLGETVTLRTKLADGLWSTLVDAAQFENALLNLAVNARDAMPRGGEITIETANRSLGTMDVGSCETLTPGPYVMLAVHDNGTGMSPEVLGCAFEPFFTTKGLGKGSGLGLSMVYGLVRQSGGHVTISSQLGKGTTVTLYLPRVQLEAKTPARRVLISGELSGKGELVLVVEDDSSVRQIAVNMLQSLGYATLQAPDAGAALELLERTPGVALVFSDIVLPGNMNGTELIEEVRRRWPRVKVLLTSGYAQREYTRKGRPDTVVKLISKPYSKAILGHALKSMLDND